MNKRLEMANNSVSVEQIGHCAIVRINNPPVNATSTAVRSDLSDAIRVVNGSDVKCAVLMCEGRTFIAGGDMSEFDYPPVEPHLPDVIQALEDSQVPFIAAMHGNVMGGGLEMMLGCAWRIATADTSFALPEVNMGLIPGAGGTLRLPRLIGLENALEMCTSGKTITAKSMLHRGGIDEIVDGEDLVKSTLHFAQRCDMRPVNVSRRVVDAVPDERLAALRSELQRKSKGQVSPMHNFDSVLTAYEPFAQAQPAERALHLKLRQSSESHALRHAFFAERSVRKPEMLQGVQPGDICVVAIFGGGLMGSGIATAMLNAGCMVTIVERNQQAASSAILNVEKNLQGALDRAKITPQQLEKMQANLTVSTDTSIIAKSDLVLEAVFEDVEIKRSLFSEVAQIVSQDCLLATNTSYLNPADVFSDVKNKERCLGLHFFSPAHIMKLLEIVALPETSKQTLSTGFSLAKRLSKVGVLCGNGEGFIGNRMLSAYRREAEYMLADGAYPNQIDNAMRSYGFAMGPFEAQDMGGLQIAWSYRKAKAQTRNKQERYVSISDQLCQVGRFGQRDKAGWYAYPDGPRSQQIDPAVTALIENYSHERGLKRRGFSETDISVRLVAILANEGAIIIEDGIAEDDAAVDMVQIHGYGFPRWRGGPMHAASRIGVDAISQTLRTISEASPKSWRIAKRIKI